MTWTRSFIHVALAVSICANAFLAHRAVKLDAVVTSLVARPELKAGNQVPDLKLTSPTGAPFNLSYGESQLPTVLYVLSPMCGWCAKNKESVSTLARALNRRARVVGISMSTKVEREKWLLDFDNDPYPFQIYTGLSDAASREFRLRSTPTTIVVSSGGEVLSVWEGAYAGKTKVAIEQYFAVNLPPFPSEVGQ